MAVVWLIIGAFIGSIVTFFIMSLFLVNSGNREGGKQGGWKMTLHEFLTRCKVPDEGFAINIFKDHIMQFKFKDIDAADIRFGEYDIADFYINFELKIISIWMR